MIVIAVERQIEVARAPSPAGGPAATAAA